MRVRWKYNRFGHVEIWDESNPTPRESDLYLQTEEDVETFFGSIGMSADDVNIDDWDYAEIESEWFGDNYAHKKINEEDFKQIQTAARGNGNRG